MPNQLSIINFNKPGNKPNKIAIPPKISSLPKSSRPREKLIEKGPENLKDEELLAILLGTGTKEKNEYFTKHFSENFVLCL